MGEADELLRASGVRLSREGRPILCGVDLAVDAGSVHALLGPNGSGKSSFAYALMGCSGYEPDAGEIRFAGRDLAGLSMTERARLGLTLAWQEPARFEGLTVRDYVGLGAGGDLERIEDALEAVALAPRAYLNRPVDRTLSGGERKRIELAPVFAMRPRLAILDEPDSGIDVLTIDDVTALIRRMAEMGTAVLLITHRDATVRVGSGASMGYVEEHFHGPHGGVVVVPRAAVTVEEGGRFSSVDEVLHLDGEGARGMTRTRIAVRDEAVSEVRTTAEGNAPFARGHMDCAEIVRGRAVASNTPHVIVRDDRAHVTHEAAIGTVNRKELETLMARGLEEDEAVDVIVRGMLR